MENIGRTVTVEHAKRSCLDKKHYASRNDARDSAAKMARKFRDSTRLRPYRCTLCGGFHLTSKVPDGLRRSKRDSKAGPGSQGASTINQRLPKEG